MHLDAATNGLKIGPLAQGGLPSCVVDDVTWSALCALDEEVLFHEQLLVVLAALPDLIIDGDLSDALTDLVLNGAGLEG
jgi:hypothetical protein